MNRKCEESTYILHRDDLLFDFPLQSDEVVTLFSLTSIHRTKSQRRYEKEKGWGGNDGLRLISVYSRVTSSQ